MTFGAQNASIQHQLKIFVLRNKMRSRLQIKILGSGFSGGTNLGGTPDWRECRRRAEAQIRLEIELIDVFLGEDMRRPEENLAAVNDFQLA